MPCSEPCGNAHTEQMDDQRRAETTLSELLTDEVIRVGEAGVMLRSGLSIEVDIPGTAPLTETNAAETAGEQLRLTRLH